MILKNSWVEVVARWILGGVFIYASYHKILFPEAFAKIIYGYYLFPDVSINLIAIFLPFVECVAGGALLLGIYPRSAAVIINGTLFCFIIAIGINIVRGHEFDCGCFSFGERGYTSSAEELFLRDIGYFLIGLYVIYYRYRRRWCIAQSGGIQSNTLH